MSTTTNSSDNSIVSLSQSLFIPFPFHFVHTLNTFVQKFYTCEQRCLINTVLRKRIMIMIMIQQNSDSDSDSDNSESSGEMLRRVYERHSQRVVERVMNCIEHVYRYESDNGYDSDDDCGNDDDSHNDNNIHNN